MAAAESLLRPFRAGGHLVDSLPGRRSAAAPRRFALGYHVNASSGRKTMLRRDLLSPRYVATTVAPVTCLLGVARMIG